MVDDAFSIRHGIAVERGGVSLGVEASAEAQSQGEDNMEWSTKWEGPSLDAKANDVAMSSLELAHEGLDVGVLQLGNTITWTIVGQPVPEPSTFVLFGIGILGLLGIGLRRVRKPSAR